jgi:hypothetical protein
VELLRQALDEMQDKAPGEAYAAVLQERDLLRARVRELEAQDPGHVANLVQQLADAKARLTQLRRKPAGPASPIGSEVRVPVACRSARISCLSEPCRVLPTSFVLGTLHSAAALPRATHAHT